ncbi:MAG: hypothetical protein MJZ74_08340 [Muribaculaceae bacterium]|nr:hypothetical protein [Muribaculaceae bacterium]
MIKKFLFLLVAMMPALAGAQSVVDTWRIHPFYAGNKLQNCIDTGDRVYYLSSNSLYCYYKDTQENESVNRSNYLSDITATGIYYDDNHKILMVAYDNGNIDVIDSDGKTRNISDIKLSQVGDTKGINHITFDDKYAYVATTFGYVVIDPVKLIVKESRVYSKDIASVARVGKWIVISTGSSLMVGDSNTYRETITQYKGTGIYRMDTQFTPIDDNRFFLASRTGLEIITLDDNGKATAQSITDQKTVQVLKTKGGYVASCPQSSCYITTDANGENAQQHEADTGELVSIASSGDGAAWGINKNGLHKVGDKDNYYMPSSIGIETNAFYTTYNPHDKKMYVSSTSDNVVLTNANHGAKTEIWAYDGYNWEDVTPENVPLYNNGVDDEQGSYNLLMLPGENNEYLFSTRSAGLCHVKDGKIVTVYNKSNMPLRDKRKTSIALDNSGNLVTVQSYRSSDYPEATLKNPVMTLPKAKLANPTTVQASDWTCPTVNGLDLKAFKRSSFVIAPGSNVKVYTTGEYQPSGPLLIWNDGKTPTVKIFTYNELKDQDGVTFEWQFIRCLTTDTDGSVWLGYNNGLVKFDPAEAFKPGFHVYRFKVARNDGTNLADYLLDGIEINCITVDGAGRKWIGTNNAGLFLVKADGTEILKSYNTDNSPLVSNTIYDVCCNPNNNSVFITTSKGVMEYFTDVIPASDDYSTIHVYPNPVRPEYGTLVTIAGLMEKSLVKILDSAGNVIKQLKSEGGLCTWDCCNDGGDRVSTGVYYVVASEHESGNGNSAVTKFVVIK